VFNGVNIRSAEEKKGHEVLESVAAPSEMERQGHGPHA